MPGPRFLDNVPYDEARLRVAADYLKEHWSPDQEEPDALALPTAYLPNSARDLSLMRHVPYYLSQNGRGYVGPLFAARMHQLLVSMGIEVDLMRVEGHPWDIARQCRLENYP